MTDKTKSLFVAILGLFSGVTVVAWPVLRHGWFTYLDNPAHLAELHSLAFDAYRGWSDVAWAGAPLGSLHSPLWYGLAAWCTRLLGSAEAIYPALVWLGVLAPPLAIFLVSRRYASTAMALLAATLVLVQPAAVVGISSATGGMWTYGIALGLLVWLWQLCDDLTTWRRTALAGAVGSLAALTHLFIFYPLVILLALRFVVPPAVRATRWRLPLVLVLTLAGSAAYWLPAVALIGDHLNIIPVTLSPSAVLMRLLMPTDGVELIKGEIHTVDAGFLTMTVFTAALAGGALLAAPKILRRQDAPALAMLTALVLLTLLLFVLPFVDKHVMGPLPWRLLAVVRVAFALALAAWLGRRWESRLPVVAVAIASVAVCGFAAGPLRDRVPPIDGEEVKHTREMWDWLRENRSSDARVYLQNTFMARYSGQLVNSHVLALTAKETGLPQLGATYGVVPFASGRYTQSQFGTLFFRRIDRSPDNSEDAEDVADYVAAAMRRNNCNLVVAVEPATAEPLARTTPFTKVYQIERYQFLEVLDPVDSWVMTDQMQPADARVNFAAGNIDIDLRTVPSSGRLLVAAAYHPFWKLRATSTATLAKDRWHLIQITGIEPGVERLSLRFEPPRWPLVAGALGWLLILGLGLRRT